MGTSSATLSSLDLPGIFIAVGVPRPALSKGVPRQPAADDTARPCPWTHFLYFVFVFVVISYVDTFLHFFICDCFLLSENSLSFLVQYFGLTIDEFPLSVLLLFPCAWERSRAGNELQ